MKRFFALIFISLVVLSLFACNENKAQENEGEGVKEIEQKISSDTVASKTSEQAPSEVNEFVLKAIVSEVDEKITVEVIESDYAFGTYWVLYSNDTEITDVNEKSIKASELQKGDVIEITYSGQVMLSYPPQIVAHKIEIVNK